MVFMKDIRKLLENASRPETVHPGALIIGEVAQAHDGSLGMAHAFIDAIAGAGADAVKFQTHLADAESTLREPWRVRFSQQDATRYDYWKRMEFTEAQWVGLKQHAESVGLVFLSSPFSLEAVALLTRVGVGAWKVASGETSHQHMLEAMLATGWPLLISTGMSSSGEIEAIARRCQSAGVAFALMQCTTAYPCPPEKVGLNMLGEWKKRLGCAVGLSDHSGTIYPGLAASALGCDVLEVHVTMSRQMFGPDVTASVTIKDLARLVQGVRYIEAMRSHPVDKDAMARETEPLRNMFGKSMVASRDLPAGTLLRSEHVAFKKPGIGLGEARLGEVLNRRLKQALAENDLILEENLE